MNDLLLMKEKVKDLKILFVDDEDDVRNSTEIFLKKFFDTVFVATNGEEALNIFTENKDIDIVLTDIQMPKKDGISLSKDIQVLKPEVIITFISATIIDIKKIENIEHIFIHKPITYDRILEFLTTISKKI